MPGSRATLQSKCIPLRNKSDAATNISIGSNLSKLEKVDSQGQRLSTYATLSTSSSTLQQPNHKQNSQLQQKQQQQSTQYLNTQQNESTRLGSPRKFNANDETRSASQEVNNVGEFQTPAAPTLPMHSPHSPLHPHLAQMHQQNKLSARYINNKATSNASGNVGMASFRSHNLTDGLSSPKRLGDGGDTKACDNLKLLRGGEVSDKTLNCTLQKTLDALPLASKLICSCEREECPKSPTKPAFINVMENISPRCNKKTLADNSKLGASSKRLVATRNAATSPHLDLRKLINMSTVSSKLAISGKVDDIAVTSKVALEKSNSLGDSKPQKQLRTTRSLSPRPPVRHQQAIIISDENEVVSVELNTAPNIKNTLDTRRNVSNHPVVDDRKHIRRRRSKNNCRSEQTSPNITDLCDKKFAYNQFTNKSTGCLVYVPTDPWLKMSEQENSRLSTTVRKPKVPTRTAKCASFDLRPLNANSADIEGDPWVKRTESIMTRSPKQERFRQAKSFSATKFDVAGVDIKRSVLRPKLQRSKSPAFNDDNLLPRSEFPLQSAPSSPHFLQTPENPFSSAFSLTCPYTGRDSGHLPNSPPQSASFSPARAKHSHNPFLEDNSPKLMLQTPPSIAIAATLAGKQQQQQQQQQCINYSFLDVSNPHLLQARHSFSSVSSKQREDELQLNIRRLSEQMRKTTQNSLVSAFKGSLSDRNVSEDSTNYQNSPSSCVSATQKTVGGADFSDYLEQFRCSEAKKAAVAAAASSAISATNDTTTSKPTITAHKSQVQADSLLETTC